jgi:hypothetical protein
MLASSLPLYDWLPPWVWVVLLVLLFGGPVFFLIVGLVARSFMKGWGEWLRAARAHFGEVIDPRGRSSEVTSELRRFYDRWRTDRKTTGESASDWIARQGCSLSSDLLPFSCPHAAAGLPCPYRKPAGSATSPN